MSREEWQGKFVTVYFENCPPIQGTVMRTPADTGDTWYIVQEPDPHGWEPKRNEYAVQSFAYIKLEQNNE